MRGEESISGSVPTLLGRADHYFIVAKMKFLLDLEISTPGTNSSTITISLTRGVFKVYFKVC